MIFEKYFLDKCKSCKLWKKEYEEEIPDCILTMSNDSENCLSYKPKTQVTSKNTGGKNND